MSASETSEIIAVVGAAIVNDLANPTHLLAARRTEPASVAGLWEFPGGKVEPGEDPLAALHREIREELTAEIDIGPEIVPAPSGHLPPVPAAVGDSPAVTVPGVGTYAGHGWVLSTRHHMRVWLVRLRDEAPLQLQVHDQTQWLRITAEPTASAGLSMVAAPASPQPATGGQYPHDPTLWDVPWIAADLPILRALASSSQ